MAVSLPDIRRPILQPVCFASSAGGAVGFRASVSAELRRGIGVVFCNQLGPDYGKYYKTGRMLIGMLAARGFDSLRFDYTGYGDSLGDYSDASVSRWRGDVKAVAAYLREQAAVQSICLAGFGFGGLFATSVAEAAAVDYLMLWEPAFDGNAFCQQLCLRHAQWLRGSFARATRGDRCCQRMGFPATAELEDGIRHLSFQNASLGQIRKVLVVSSEDSSDGKFAQDALERSGVEVVAERTSAKALPVRPMGAVVSWLMGCDERA